MAKLLRRASGWMTCFYCQSDVEPRNPRSFRCPQCGCLNRYDAKGEIISDEPAMHDESLNKKAFARRASPRKDLLPSNYGDTSRLFCRTCQSNQFLLSSLLSNYLPEPHDSTYPLRLKEYPEYRETLYERYPPVCAECAPAVEEEIKRRDIMARTRTLGKWLDASKPKDKQKVAESTREQKEKFERSLVYWYIRGILWCISLLTSLGLHAIVATGHVLPIPVSALPSIPFAVFISVLWTAWDPTYANVKRNQLQGRVLWQRGRKEYNVLQSLSWISRLIVSIILLLPRYRPTWNYPYYQDPIPTRARIFSSVCFSLELLIFLRSLIVLQIQKPPAIRLNDEASRRPRGLSPSPTNGAFSRGVTPSNQLNTADVLGSLSLSEKFAGSSNIPINHPIFGIPSLPNLNAAAGPSNAKSHSLTDDNAMDEDEDDNQSTRDDDPDAMDWTPTSTPAKNLRKGKAKGRTSISDDGSWLRPQRFFPPEEPTGLEHLFEQTIKLADDDRPSADQRRSWLKWMPSSGKSGFLVGAFVSLIIVPLAAWGYSRWQAYFR